MKHSRLFILTLLLLLPLQNALANNSPEITQLVSQEKAQLAAFAASLDALDTGFREQEKVIENHKATVLYWRTNLGSLQGAAAHDAAYPALRKELRQLRITFAELLSDAGAGKSRVPTLWPDPLRGIGSEAVADSLSQERALLAEQILLLQQQEQALIYQEAEALDFAISELNSHRIQLLPKLSPTLRHEITGFTETGFEQVRTELWHLSLLVRHHALLLGGTLSQKREISPFQIWGGIVTGTPILLCLVVFYLSRRYTRHALEAREQALLREEFARGDLQASPWRRLLRFLLAILHPLEWNLLYFALLWLMPETVTPWLEFRLINTVIGWLLVGSLVIHLINALPQLSTNDAGQWKALSSGGLRLRSLRLVGQFSIGIGVALNVTAVMVGKGSIYHWVASAGWLLLLLPAITLVRWWEEPIFAQAAQAASRWKLLQWVSLHQQGATKWLAAPVGGITLLGLTIFGTLKQLSDYIELGRRIRLLLGNPEQAEGKETIGLVPPEPNLLALFSPDTPSLEIREEPVQELMQTITRLVQEKKSGLIAVTGSRGSGRSTLFSLLGREMEHVLLLQGRELFRQEPETWPTLTDKGVVTAVLVDDAHYLMEPRPGGLYLYDRFLAHAREQAGKALWVLALDQTCWAFLRRARDNTNPFDKVLPMKPWDLAELKELVARRSAAASITPQFLPMPAEGSEEERNKQMALRKEAFFRVLWNYSCGNPAIALDAWCRSLRQTENGSLVVIPALTVRQLSIDTQSDAALFVLKVVLMTEPATAALVCVSLDMEKEEVMPILHAAVQQGLLKEEDDHFSVCWPWRRAIIDLLERKHLLAKV
jgi:hypothetical protein